MRGMNSQLSPLTNVTLPAYAIRVYLNLHCPAKTIAMLTVDEYDFCRKAMRGGRTDVRRMLKEWTPQDFEVGDYGQHVDIQSMYPFVQFNQRCQSVFRNLSSLRQPINLLWTICTRF